MFIAKQNIIFLTDMLAEDIFSGHHKNILIIGKSGYGKTTLAKHIADKTYLSYVFTYGFNFFYDPEFRFFIVDEIHTSKNYEVFFRFMDLNNSTFVFTTTELGILPEPFINRCITIDIGEYNIEELKIIARHYGINYSDKVLSEVVNRSRYTPRLIVKIIERLDMFQRNKGVVNGSNIKQVLNMFGIYDKGLTDLDLKYIEVLKYNGPLSLTSLVKSTGIPKETIENYIEPTLLKLNMIKINNKGRNLLEEV